MFLFFFNIISFKKNPYTKRLISISLTLFTLNGWNLLLSSVHGRSSLALHLKVQDLGVAGGSEGDEFGVKEFEDSITDVGELRLDLGSIVPDHGHVVLAAVTLLLLLNRGDDAPQGLPRADHVLVRHKEKVSLLDGDLLALHRRRDLLRELHHLLVPLGLLGKLRHLHVLFASQGCHRHCFCLVV